MISGVPDTEIARRAYDLWVSEGRPHGRDREHWAQAEREAREAASRTAAADVGAASPPESPKPVRKPATRRKPQAAAGEPVSAPSEKPMTPRRKTRAPTV